MSWLRHLPHFQRAYRALEALELRESWSRGEIEAFQLERINSLWRHATRHVPYYRQLTARQPLPQRFASLDEFTTVAPLLPRAVINHQSRQFLSEQAGRGIWRSSSGSTGRPTEFFSARDCHREMLATRYRHLAMWDVDVFDRTVFLWGQSALFQSGVARLTTHLRQTLEDRLRRRLRLSAYHLGPQNLRQYLRAIERFQPTMIYAYSMALYLLALELPNFPIRNERLKVALLSAEPAYPPMVEAIEAAFGVPAVIEYGATECGVIASEWPDRTLRVREDIALVETLPRDDGRYDLFVTPLYNWSFPLVRYAIGDVTDQPLTRPERGFAQLGAIVGRSNDLLITQSGATLHPTRLETLFENELFHQVRCFAIHQQRDGRLAVQLELKDPGQTVDLPWLRGELAELVEGFPVEIEVVPRVTKTHAGKHRWISSDLAQVRFSAPPNLTAAR